MKIRRIFNIILSCILIITSIPFTAVADEYENVEYAPGEIVITTDDELIDTSTTFVTFSEEDYTLIDFKEEKINSVEEINTYNDTDNEHTYVINVNGDVSKKCKELEQLPGVKYAEPNIIFHTTSFSMPSEITSSSLYRQHMKWYFDLMHIPDAWSEFETAGEGVIVAVIDNGFKINATDFSTNLWTDEEGNHGWNTSKNSADISPIYKKDGTAFDNTFHGTHVAGIIGAAANNNNMIGAAYNAELMLINAAHYNSETSNPNFYLDDLVEAIDFARMKGADIINLSVGAHAVSNNLENTVNRAYEAGIAIIAAAGNEKTSTIKSKTIPASYENVIGVMASDKSNPNQLTSFSNYDPTGKYYDVVAPGYELLSCSIEQGKAAYGSGTSQACPLVAACAALYMAEYPNATVDELYEAIRKSPEQKINTNSTIAPNETCQFGLLDARLLLEYGKIMPEIKLNINTNVTKDESLGYIWGLDEGFTDINKFITVTEGTGVFEFIPNETGIGTGSIINIYDIYGNLYKTYTVIVFGDLNGDATVDGQDAVIISCVMKFNNQFTAAQKFASDVDFDGLITQNDYTIAANTALLLDFVSQIR